MPTTENSPQKPDVREAQPQDVKALSPAQLRAKKLREKFGDDFFKKIGSKGGSNVPANKRLWHTDRKVAAAMGKRSWKKD